MMVVVFSSCSTGDCANSIAAKFSKLWSSTGKVRAPDGQLVWTRTGPTNGPYKYTLDEHPHPFGANGVTDSAINGAWHDFVDGREVK